MSYFEALYQYNFLWKRIIEPKETIFWKNAVQAEILKLYQIKIRKRRIGKIIGKFEADKKFIEQKIIGNHNVVQKKIKVCKNIGMYNVVQKHIDRHNVVRKCYRENDYNDKVSSSNKYKNGFT
jgi:hypothetical protein